MTFECYKKRCDAKKECINFDTEICLNCPGVTYEQKEIKRGYC